MNLPASPHHSSTLRPPPNATNVLVQSPSLVTRVTNNDRLKHHLAQPHRTRTEASNRRRREIDNSPSRAELLAAVSPTGMSSSSKTTVRYSSTGIPEQIEPAVLGRLKSLRTLCAYQHLSGHKSAWRPFELPSITGMPMQIIPVL